MRAWCARRSRHLKNKDRIVEKCARQGSFSAEKQWELQLSITEAGRPVPKAHKMQHESPASLNVSRKRRAFESSVGSAKDTLLELESISSEMEDMRAENTKLKKDAASVGRQAPERKEKETRQAAAISQCDAPAETEKVQVGDRKRAAAASLQDPCPGRVEKASIASQGAEALLRLAEVWHGIRAVHGTGMADAVQGGRGMRHAGGQAAEGRRS